MKIVSDAMLIHKMLAIGIFVLLSALSFSPFVTAEQVTSETSERRQELDLLRGEHYLFVNATEDVASFHIRYAYPPSYNYQVPIMLEIIDDSTAEILNYEIKNDTYAPNKIIDFTIGPLEKGSIVSLHFYLWVLVENNEYSNLPLYVRIPKKCQLPEETKMWLSSTDVVQVNNFFIKRQAQEVRGISSNLLLLSKRIAHFAKWHHLTFYTIQLLLGTLKSQDAVTTLFRNGDCPGRSHLSCALFRANGVPARVVMGNRNYPFWYQMHFMIEYYCPGYGWIQSEVHSAKTPYEPKNQIVMRICSPDDENNTGHDFFFPQMTGVEHWFWIDNTAVVPYFKDLKEGSKVNMFPEQELFVDTESADSAFVLTQFVSALYTQYTGMSLTGENLLHYQQAIVFQHQAIQDVIHSDNVNGYLLLMNQAYMEYQAIHL